MILWTIQPRVVWNLIQQTGVYRCDPILCSMPEQQFTEKYRWLIDQMSRRIGPPPEGVAYPVWAWHTQNRKHKKPDLRSERWCNGPGGEHYVCIELEVPDDQVVLSDFDSWCTILNNGLLDDSKEESEQLNASFEAMNPVAQKVFKYRNWERVFDVSPLDNEWIRRGKWIQGTFWELRKDMIRNAWFFVTGRKKMGYGMTGDQDTFAVRWVFLDETHDTELYMYINGVNVLAFERDG